MVGVQSANGSTVWFDQRYPNPNAMKGVGNMVVGEGKFSVRNNGPGEGYKTASKQVPAAQAAKAMDKAKSMIGTNTYNPVTNSCVSCAKQVLKAGGVKPPATAVTPNALYWYMKFTR
jgi:hypothetical protein